MSTTYIGTLNDEECCKCHCIFGLDSRHQARLRQNGETFYCPNGHPQHYSKPEIQCLKDELLREKQAREQAETSRDRWRENSERTAREMGHQIRGQKAAKTRLKNRIKNGVCPCCTRMFQNLHQHMSTQHPDYMKEPV